MTSTTPQSLLIRGTESTPIALSVVIPVYRGMATIQELCLRLTKVLEQRQTTFEILLIEDCGGDSSWEVIQSLTKNDQRIRGFRLRRNFGQHNALLLGIRTAQGELIATMDDDLQHPPEELPKLLDQLQGVCDVVYGAPERQQHGLMRDIASQGIKFVLQKSMGHNAAQNVSAFRVFRTELRDAFAGYNSPLVNIDVMLTWATQSFSAVHVNHQPREFGRSGYNVFMLVRHAINMIVGFSTIPLTISSILGFVLSSFGIVVLFYVIIKYIVVGGSVPGFPFLASIIALFSGAQLLALGMVGEYLARLYQRSMGSPSYIVRESTVNSIIDSMPENEK
ncbi:MAG: glycosyltransferase family 2 protein [Acetobacter sp.]